VRFTKPNRVERYNTIAEEAVMTKAATTTPHGNGVLIPAESSPPAKDPLPTETSQVDAGSPRLPALSTATKSQIFSTSAQASPASATAASRDSSGTWTVADPLMDAHLSGQEPRLFPGVVSQGQRKNSLQKSSSNENNAVSVKRTPSRKEKAATDRSVIEQDVDGQ
jgi:hypothetical protein